MQRTQIKQNPNAAAESDLEAVQALLTFALHGGACVGTDDELLKKQATDALIRMANEGSTNAKHALSQLPTTNQSSASSLDSGSLPKGVRWLPLWEDKAKDWGHLKTNSANSSANNSAQNTPAHGPSSAAVKMSPIKDLSPNAIIEGVGISSAGVRTSSNSSFTFTSAHTGQEPSPDRSTAVLPPPALRRTTSTTRSLNFQL